MVLFAGKSKHDSSGHRGLRTVVWDTLKKRGTLQRFRDTIASVEFLQHEAYKGLELFKCKIILTDGSNLRILEKYRDDNLVYYSYYWLTAGNELIIGWDCAPHHPQLESFPHHKHLAGQMNPVASSERGLAAVMAFVTDRLN